MRSGDGPMAAAVGMLPVRQRDLRNWSDQDPVYLWLLLSDFN